MAYKKISGIYKITSPSSKVYIGKSVSLKSRINSYKNVNNLHRHRYQVRLYNSFKKYGVENHVFEIIEECEESELYCRERYWQEYYSSTGSLGLNCMLTECKEHSRVISEEVRKKMSERMSGENNPMFGIDWTENKTEDEIKEWKDKISKSLKGRVFTEEHKKNLRGKTGDKAYWYGKKGELHPSYGKKLTQEQKDKIRDFMLSDKNPNRGKPRSKESIEKGAAKSRKKVINVETLEVLDSAKMLSLRLNIKYSTIKSQLNGTNPNKSGWVYLEDYTGSIDIEKLNKHDI